MTSSSCKVHRLGLVDYEQAWHLQDSLAEEIAQGKRGPTLLLLEHPHTFTFGRRGKAENLLWDMDELQRRGVSVHWVDRGGDVTYHGPGQLVGYPLLPLGINGLTNSIENGEPRLPKADYVGYVRRMEQALILSLARFEVEAFAMQGLTGVWVSGSPGEAPSKIAAIGVKVDARGVTRHGFALNVNPDMSYWEGIVGCGLKEHGSTSLKKILKTSPAMVEVQAAVIEAFAVVFGFDMLEEQLPA